MIVVDSREPKSVIAGVQKYCLDRGIPVVPRVGEKPPALFVGDALVIGKYITLIVERKTTMDLAASIVDGRWESQVARLVQLRAQRLMPLVVVYGPAPRHLADGKLQIGATQSKRVATLPFAAYMNAQLSAQLAGVPVLFGGSLRYPEYLGSLWRYTNKKKHRIGELGILGANKNE